MISFACPQCGKRLKVKDELAGKKARCPGCGQSLRIPAPVAAPARLVGEAPPIPPGPEAVEQPHDDTVAGSDPADPELTAFLAPPQGPDELGRLGPYRVLKVLGAGGMGVVFQAEDPGLLRLVALKAMLPGQAVSSTARQRFLREARAAAAIKHDHIVTIYQVGEDQSVPFLAMEFLEGEPLDERLERAGPLPAAEVVRIGRQIAEGLAAAHELGLIHRDIKPANIWLEGANGRVKILDFGLARAVGGDAQLSLQGAIVGTPAYMAPEQAAGLAVDARGDLFSLGSVLYRMCTGQPAFHGKDTLSTLMAVATEDPPPPHEVNPAVPPALSELVIALLSKKPDDRPPTARAVVEALDAVAQDRTEVAALSGRLRRPPPKPPAPTGKGRGLLIAAVAGVLGLFGVMVVVAALVIPRLSSKPATKDGDPAAKDGEQEMGWVSLFNGKDLTGWKFHPDQLGDWKVEDGALVGRSNLASHLFSERGDYENFHFRAEAKLSAKCTSGLFFRSEFGLNDRNLNKPLTEKGMFPLGYKAQLITEAGPKQKWPTGSLLRYAAATEELARPDEWLTQEVIADGDRIVIKVNGTTTAEYTDPHNTYVRGRLALQIMGADSMVQFRKIEVKELPPTPPEKGAWSQLFNGYDLVGWKLHPDDRGQWSVKAGELIGSAGPSHLFTGRDDFENFHFRIEAKFAGGTNSGQYFRAEFGPGLPRGYEAQIIGGKGAKDDYGTGSLYGFVKVADVIIPTNTWFTQEVIADGERIRILVNGKQTVDYLDSKKTHTRGHLALQLSALTTKSVMTFRKIQIKELWPPRK